MCVGVGQREMARSKKIRLRMDFLSADGLVVLLRRMDASRLDADFKRKNQTYDMGTYPWGLPLFEVEDVLPFPGSPSSRILAVPLPNAG